MVKITLEHLLLAGIAGCTFAVAAMAWWMR
jgi:uncharacterized OsmC-like protein